MSNKNSNSYNTNASDYPFLEMNKRQHVLDNIAKDLNYDHTNVLNTYKNIMLEPWLKVLEDEGYHGDIYLLVYRYVSSSSQSFVQFMSDTELAYIIGEPTAGEGSGFDPLLLRLLAQKRRTVCLSFFFCVRAKICGYKICSSNSNFI